VFDFFARLPPLDVSNFVVGLPPYQHRLLGLSFYQNPQHVHAHKGPFFLSIFS
jgi:hypothetical protein